MLVSPWRWANGHSLGITTGTGPLRSGFALAGERNLHLVIERGQQEILRPLDRLIEIHQADRPVVALEETLGVEMELGGE